MKPIDQLIKEKGGQGDQPSGSPFPVEPTRDLSEYRTPDQPTSDESITLARIERKLDELLDVQSKIQRQLKKLK